ncbi:MAG: hypothetical protein FWH55_00275 [Oscillospiraceae bacterium]|nr:hypothetical protein [Oscillospiraceae bacterium]
MSRLNDFINSGEKDLPVYITDIRRDFLLCNGVELVLILKNFDGTDKRIFLKLPVLEIQSEEQRIFLRDYLFAEVYNTLSALGGSHLSIYTLASDENLSSILKELQSAFGIGCSRKERIGYGRCVNVIERMLDSQGMSKPFQISVIQEEAPAVVEKQWDDTNSLSHFLKAFDGIDERILCGVDIGGTDIKLAVSVRGKLRFLKEYDWFPAKFTRSRQLIEPVRLLIRLLRARISCDMTDVEASVISELDSAVNKYCADDEIEAAILRAEQALGNKIIGFDSIGLCFPDVVIRNKIIGGEVFKTRGIRENPNIDYETEFRKLMNLDDILIEYCSPGGGVYLANDGSMAAFTASLELIAADKSTELKNGRFAHTLGTELGTGWIDISGNIPEIPLEVYNFIIDLGSFAARKYHPDDLRSINNFNTGLPGTLQKFMAQSGVFRLAIKTSKSGDCKLYRDMIDKGFIYENNSGVFLVMEPNDMRKPLLEYLMKLCEEGDLILRDVFLEIGRSTGIAFCETDHILHPSTKERVMYGRLVKNPLCFSLLKKGAEETDKALQMSVADEQNAFTDLMLQLKAHPLYSVAQFAQSVGAIYYGNLQLRSGMAK